MLKRNLIIFDGSNFYHFVKRLDSSIHLTNFNYIKFCEIITKQKLRNKIVYCVGEIKQSKRNKKTIKLLHKNCFYPHPPCFIISISICYIVMLKNAMRSESSWITQNATSKFKVLKEEHAKQ